MEVLSPESAKEILHCELFEMDGKFPFYPTSAVDFIVRMAEIPFPLHQLPVFGITRKHRLMDLSSEDTCRFFSEFDGIIKRAGVLTDELKMVILEFFDIQFVFDTTHQDIDVLCYEAFGDLNVNEPPAKKTKSKRSKQYNSPIVKTVCSNCDENTMRLKLIKKISNAKLPDLLKFDQCIRSIKVENAFLATLPPINEIDKADHEK